MKVTFLVGPNERAALDVATGLVPVTPAFTSKTRQGWKQVWKNNLAIGGSLSANASGLVDYIDSLAEDQKVFLKYPESGIYPQVQSRIANMLLNACDAFKLQFVVLTASEYIIRQSQVLVKEFCKNGMDINDIPFQTYFFPSKNDRKIEPYDMKYCKDGRFSERFGIGFYDEAIELAIQVF